MTDGIITNIQRFSIHDGPGIRTTVFVKGCSLRCRWCDNPETLESCMQIFFIEMKCKECGKCVIACPYGYVTMDKSKKIDRNRCVLCMKCVEACKYGALQKIGEKVTAEKVVEEVKKDAIFYRNFGGGMTLSGGESLLQPEFSSKIFELCKKQHIHTVLDTSGFASWDATEKVLRYVDLVLLDIKHMDSKKHKLYTQVPNELILENAEKMASKIEVRIGIPLIPGFNDSRENIKKTAEFGVSIGVDWIDVMPLHKIGGQKYKFLGLENPYPQLGEVSDEHVKIVRKIIESYGLKTTLGRYF